MDQDDFDEWLSVLGSEESTPSEVREAIRLISEMFVSDLSTVESQVYVAKAVDTRNGIFKFVLDAYQGEVVKDNSNVSESFAILEYLVLNYKLAVEPHANAIINWCLGTLVRENPLRSRSLQLMEMILITCPCTKVDMKNLVENLKKFLDMEKKLSCTLRHHVFSLLGEICKIQPGAISDSSEWFINTLVLTLNEYETSKHKSVILVEGAFIGLLGCMTSFPLQEETASCVYKHINNFFHLGRLGERHTANRAALRLYAKHSSAFSNLICADAKNLIDVFSDWIAENQTAEHKQIGLVALTETYHQIALAITSLSEEQGKKLFNSIKTDLEVLLKKADCPVHVHKKAVIGLGELSSVYIRFECKNELLTVLNTITVLSDTVSENEAFAISIYVESIAKILAVLHNSPSLHLSQLSVLLIQRFSKTPTNFKMGLAATLESSFVALSPRGVEDLKGHVRVVLYQGLIRSCAHPLHIDVELTENEQRSSDSYKAFIPLWKNLLTIKSRTNISPVGSIVYDSFVEVFIELISKLDLTLVNGMIERSDPSLAYEAHTPNDFQIFVNLVDLFMDVIPDSDHSLLIKWIPFVIREIVGLSKTSPLVSGFYKILAVIFQVAPSDFTLTDFDLVEVIHFIDDVISRVLVQKDDLQIACLKMILRAPLIFIEPLLDRLDLALSAAVRIGAGYPDLLQLCISSLDIWLSNLAASKTQKLLQQILPLLRPLLNSTGNNQRNEGAAKNSKRPLKVSGKLKKKTIVPVDKKSLTLQKQLILFLGKLDPALYPPLTEPIECHAVLPGASLEYEIPGQDPRPHLQVNELVPRILDIANSSSDRRIRVTACELLHAVLILAIEKTRKTDQPQLIRKLLDTALLLSCDSDKVVHDLFNPLMLQICRYYSGKVQSLSNVAAAVIEVLTEGCAHPFDSSIRDFSGLCIREFVCWSRRQQGEVMDVPRDNIRAIIRKICEYSSHPARSKRLGAAVVFNNIYAETREDTEIMSTYWFQLFHCFMHSLEMSDDDESARVIMNSIDHVRRPIIEMKHIFLVFADKRRIPKSFRGGTLIDLAIYTFYKGSSLNRNVRRKAREIFMDLLVNIPGRFSMGEFLSMHNVPVNCKIENKSPDGIVAFLDYINWLLEKQAVDLEDVSSFNVAELSTTLLSEVVKQANPQLETVNCILKYFSNTISSIETDCSKNLARLLFKLKIPVHDEFVALLSRLRGNKSAMEDFKSVLPRLDKDYITSQLQRFDQISFFLAFEILDTSLMLSESYSGDDLLRILFDCLFSSNRGRRVIGKFIDPGIKKYLIKMLNFAFKCGVKIEAMFTCLRDKTQVHYDSKTSTKGDIFFGTYKDLIVDYITKVDANGQYILKLADEGLCWMISILKSCQERNATAIPNYLEKWSEIEEIVKSHDTRFAILELIASKNQYGCFINYKGPFDWLHKVLRSKHQSIQDIVSAFALLPQISSRLETSNNELTTSLITFRRQKLCYFDMGPYAPRSENGIIIRAIYKGLFSSLEATSSLVVLKFIAENMARHVGPIALNDVDLVIASIVKNSPEDHVLKMLNELYLLVKSPMDMSSAICIRERLAIMLQSCSQELVTAFFGSYLAEIYEILTSEVTQRLQIKDKITCVRLVEVLFFKTNKTQLKQNIPNFFREILTNLSEFPSGPLPTGDGDLWRAYYCACVKMLCAFVCQVNTEAAYRTCLFAPTIGFWKSVSDLKKKYDFRMDFSQIPKRKKILTSIRQAQKNSQGENLLYPQSQVLFESSLREDVTKFDMSNFALSQNPVNSNLVTEEVRAVELELDSLNQHEIVAAICGVIEHMVDEKMPTYWLDSFRSVLVDGPRCDNAKLLVLKIIHNLQGFVKPYASQCATDILKAAVALLSEVGVNYFAMDLITMLIDWQPDLSNCQRDLTSLIKYLISSPSPKRKDIIKYILEHVKSLIEMWKGVIDQTDIADFLLNNINKDKQSEMDQSECYINLRLASILLTNKIFPCGNNYVETLLSWLLKCMKAENNNYQLASEVLGEALNSFRDIENFTALSEKICKAIIEMNRKRTKGDTDNINRLYYTHKFYPEISSHELVTTNLEVRALEDNSSVREYCLEMLLSHVKRGHDIQEAAKLILEALKTNIPVVVDISIKIFIEYIEKIECHKLSDILEQLIKLSNNPVAEVRIKSCEALIHAQESKIGMAEELKNECKIILLRKLNDSDDSVRKVCEEYWYDMKKLLHKNSREKWLCVLQDLYFPELEFDFVAYSCTLILGGVSFGPSYELPIFDVPLGDCSYSDYQILSSWRARHSSLAPLFAPSIAGELSRLDVERPISASAYNEQIRATARSLLFSPTLADDFVINSAGTSRSQETQNDGNGVFKKPKTPSRFSRNNSPATFAGRAVAAKDREEAELKDRAKSRDTDVKLYRKYRKGDYPDIQIKHSHFIAPLVALAREDAPLAKQLFICLFNSFTRGISENDSFWNAIGIALETMLEKTTLNSLFLSVVFQLALNKSLVLDSEYVCRAAKNSGLFTLGSLVIEQSLVHCLNEGETRQKRRKQGEDELSTLWLYLLQLFQGLEDTDGQQGIFLDKLAVTGAAKKAIHYEAAHDWVTAADSYYAALSENDSEDRLMFYFQSFLKCLANLCEWNKVNDVILKNEEQLSKDSWFSDVMCELYLHSTLMTSLHNKTDKFQLEICSTAYRASKFSLMRTIGSWLGQDYPKTLTYFNQSCLSFLSDWSEINNWDTKRKESCLLKLQLLSEVNDIVEVVSAVSRESAVAVTLKNWSVSNPSAQSDLITWDTRLALRKRLTTFLEDNQISDFDLQEVKNSVRNKELMLTKTAIELENFRIAKKYCSASKRDNDAATSYYHDLLIALGYKLESKEPAEKIKKYKALWKDMEQKIANAMDVDDANVSDLRVKLRRAILNIITTISSLAEDCKKDVNYKRSLQENWKKNAEVILETLGSGCNELVQKGEVYVEMAKFHRKYQGSNIEIVKAILKGMSCGNAEARHLFGWVLTMDKIVESSELLEYCANVPTWMFLLWRNQLLAFLSTGESTLIKNIIKRIALEYPKALSHGFRVSLESYSKTMITGSFVNEIRKLVLSDSLEESFVIAISRVAIPLLKFKHFLDQVSLSDLIVAKEALKAAYDVIIDEENGGIYQCLATFKSKLEELMAETNLQTLKESLMVLKVGLQVDIASRNFRIEKQLKLYSPWLSSFQTSDIPHDLEIPGQYSGFSEPKPLNHIRIVGFKPELLCLSSKRRPFKLTMLGNDAKEYSFLVKFGEDLRQDERIQQVLKQMQNTLHSKKLTSDVHLEGFSVIPLTSACGIVEWLDSTKTLRELIIEKMETAETRKSKITRKRLDEMQKQHLALLASGATKELGVIESYIWAYNKLSDQSAIEGYHRLVNTLPEFSLREAFCELSSSPEHMVYLRRNFAKSLAAMNIGHWLIGVGDRHLDNALVSIRTGRVIGIDFGIAFGYASQFLVPAELIPFRLTPQLVNCFSPLKESGWLKQTMIRSLRVLREDPSTLLAMLEVFVLEPSMDWKQQAELLAKERGVEAASFDNIDYPRQKIDAVKRKLTGVNPTAEIAEDLHYNRRLSAAPLHRLLSILMGKPGVNVRADLSKIDLSPEEQVASLIDLAMDPLVLSFTYVGWHPWL